MTPAEDLARARARRRALVAELSHAGAGVYDIAQMLGVTARTVGRDLWALKSEEPSPSEAWVATVAERRALVEELCLEGLTIHRIAAHLGVSYRTVERDRRVLGLSGTHTRYTPEEHARISGMLADGCSVGEVARTLGRNYSYLLKLYPHVGWTPAQVGQFHRVRAMWRRLDA